MLELLAKKDSQWRKMAYKICGCHILADDLVSEMYLKVYNIEKEINDGYIYRVIKSIFLNEKIKQSKVILVNIDSIQLPDDSNEYDTEQDVKILASQKSLQKLKGYEQLIIKHSYEDGLRHFSRESGISKSTVQNIRKKHKEKSWQELKKIKESETLYNQLQTQSA
jgi:RNA polymerase sigma factor (sigma-70 family)